MHGLVSSLQDPIVAGAAVLIVLGLVALVMMRRRRASPPVACSVRPRLLEPDELALLEALRAATGADVSIWPHVHAAVVLRAPPDAPRHQRRRIQRALADECFDFVLVSARGEALAAVRCAHGDRRQSAGGELKALCDLAGLPLLALDPNADYPPEALREHLQWHMRGTASQSEASVDVEGRREPLIDLPPE